MAAFFLGDTAINLSKNSMSSAASPLEVLPRDLSPYRQGNTGIDYVVRPEKPWNPHEC